jgi:hypothetical protein
MSSEIFFARKSLVIPSATKPPVDVALAAVNAALAMQTGHIRSLFAAR